MISLEGSHFGSRESTPFLHQNSQTSNEECADMSINLGLVIVFGLNVKKSSIFVKFQSSTFDFFSRFMLL